MNNDSANENISNLVVSDLFGTFKHCEPSFGLIPFFKNGISAENEVPACFNGVIKADYFFQIIPAAQHGKPCLFIVLTHACGTYSTLIIIPSLVISDLPGIMPPAHNNKTWIKVAEHYAAIVNGSLLLSLDGNETEIFYRSRNSVNLFYVTAHKKLPLSDIKSISKVFASQGFQGFHIYWINWQTAVSELEASLNRSQENTLDEESSRITKTIYYLKLLLPLYF
ncbi:MAG: hypothetical protein M0P57_09045 [Syntrophales bacterium]|jgi:hypothetical protein|nr:hypothetical protein [Syntrophales bacterium]MDY0045491.1 hypothetical protein [Syntrophales bacterium]